MRVELVVGGADERLGEIHRVVDDRHHGQEIAVPDPVFGDGGLVAARHAVAPDVAFLEMRDGDRQHVAVPLPRRKATPAMQRVVHRTLAAVEIDGVVDRAQPLGVKRGDLARQRIFFLADGERRRTAPDVIGRVRTALPFR